MDWFEIINWLALSTGLDRDSLHIYAGVGVQLIVALIFRRSLASPVPWLLVAVAALTNEYYDYSFVADNLNARQEYFDGAIRDVWNTLLLPSLLLVIARYWPTWLTGRAKTVGEPEKLDVANPPI